MSTIKVNAIQHTTANASNMTLFANGNVAMTTANTTLTVGNTTISNSGISVGGAAISQYGGMMKNRIINGDMRIDQRFSGAANNNITGQNQYVVDRWYTAGSSAGKLRFQQNNTNGPSSAATQLATGFSNYFGANTVSANTVNAGDYWYFSQAIEGYNISDLNWGTAVASPATLSFWVYSSIAGTHGGSIFNSNVDRAYPFTYNINTANTWQYQTITIPGDTTGSWFSNTGIGMLVIHALGIGSTYDGTNNTWSSGVKYPTGIVKPVSAANGAFYVTGVQLEKGSQATAFDWRHYGTELALCQRYYNVIAKGIYNPIGTGFYYSGTAVGCVYNFPVEMRNTPTLCQVTGTNYYYAARNSDSDTFNSFYINDVSVKCVTLFNNTEASGTAGHAAWIVTNNGNSYVALSAELVVQN